MFCNKCGNELKEDWVKCPYCGQMVADNIKVDESIKMPQQTTSDFSGKNLPSKEPEKFANKKILLGIGGGIATVIAVLAFIVLLGNKIWEGKQIVPEETVSEENSIVKESGDLDDVQTSNVQENDEEEDVDLEGMLGQPEQELEEWGFTYDEDETCYELLDGDIVVKCSDGKVNLIGIRGSLDDTWGIHGISLGMSLDEAEALMADSYIRDDEGEMEDSLVYYIDWDLEKLMTFSENQGIITGIVIANYKEEIREEQSQEYIFPESDGRYLSEEEVRVMEADKLRLGRNEIFARHGYIFNDEELSQYFNNTSWYNGTVPSDQFDMDELLNDFEKRNIELIESVENEVGATSEQFVIPAGIYANNELFEDYQALMELTYYEGMK